MKKRKLLILKLLFFQLFDDPTLLSADTLVQGQVKSNGNSLPFAIVGIKGTTYGAQADVDGNFILKSIPAGDYIFIASSMGFQSLEVRKSIIPDKILRIDFELEQSAIEIDGIAITGSLMRSFVKESPTKVLSKDCANEVENKLDKIGRRFLISDFEGEE